MYTNDKLFRFKTIASPLCTFYQKEDEFLKHLLFHLISKQNISMEMLSLNTNYVLFGVFNDNEDFAILNHLILIATVNSLFINVN